MTNSKVKNTATSNNNADSSSSTITANSVAMSNTNYGDAFQPGLELSRKPV